MKEFDKIYIAKYKDILTTRQLAEDLKTSNTEIEYIIQNLKAIGLMNIYQMLPDEEWEKLEKYSDERIRTLYYKESKIIQEKAKKEIFKNFGTALLKECLDQFEQYQQEEKDFYEQYQQEENYLDEEWKKVGNLNYLVSNYGRIKNANTNKLKKLKYQRFGMQINLWNAGQGTTVTISRLVAEMFIRHTKKEERVIHIDGNIRNNYYKNLKIVCK